MIQAIRRRAGLLAGTLGLATALALTLAPTPASASAGPNCNAGAPACISINGHSNYISYVDGGYVVTYGETVTGFMVIKTMLPASNGFRWVSPKPFYCHAGITIRIKTCWVARLVLNRWLGLNYTSGRTPHQQICVILYANRGNVNTWRRIRGPACLNVYR